MPNALKGSAYLEKHPEARAKDFMDALKDKILKELYATLEALTP